MNELTLNEPAIIFFITENTEKIQDITAGFFFVIFSSLRVFVVCILPGNQIFTARKRSLGQGNIFAPVCHSVHRGVYPCMLVYTPQCRPPGTRGRQPPRSRPPRTRGRHPLRSRPLWDQRQAHPTRSRHPLAGAPPHTPSRYTLWAGTPPWAGTPLAGTAPLGRYIAPRQVHPSAGTHPPWQVHTPCTVQAGIRLTSGRYASHWNAIFFG